jgi:hypothetical protein
MWTDLLTLARLEWKRLRQGSRYWLRLIGFEPGSSAIYQFYIAVFWAVWLFVVWALAVDQVQAASQQITPADATFILEFSALAVFGLQVRYLILVLLDPPLKLTTPDLAYVATAPIAGGSITLIRFLRALTVPAVLHGLASALLALFFWESIPATETANPALGAFGVGVLLVYGSAAWAWAMALLPKPIGWAMIPLLAAGLWLAPGVVLWPGTLLMQLVEGTFGGQHWMILVGLLVAGVVAVGAVGNTVSMIRVMERSHVYARVQRLGAFGKMMAPQLIARIEQQARLARNRRLRVRLPLTTGALFGRSLVGFIRLSPRLPLQLLVAGFFLTTIVTTIIGVGGTESLQTWVLVLFAVMMFRFSNLMIFYQSSFEHPFLHQFMRGNPLRALLSQTAMPLIPAAVGVCAALALQPLSYWALGLTALLLLVLLHALEITRLRYEFGVVLMGTGVISVGILTGSLWGSWLAGLIGIALASALLYTRSGSTHLSRGARL